MVYDEINILGSSIYQSKKPNSIKSVMLRTGAILVIKEKLLNSYLMPQSNFN